VNDGPVNHGPVNHARGFPGAVGVSRLRVYDWPTVDGLRGGSPHLHTASTEGYVVLDGTGQLQTLGGAGYSEFALEPGTVLWFTPGTVHRLVDTGSLEILVVMQNAGLPEAGDAVFTFPPDVLVDTPRYAAAARIPSGVGPDAADAARRRRDLAVDGFLALRDDVLARGPAALRPLYAVAARLVRDKVPGWRHTWRDRALAQAALTGRHLTALDAGDPGHLAQAQVFRAGDAGHDRYGLCGRLSLSAWDLDDVPGTAEDKRNDP